MLGYLSANSINACGIGLDVVGVHADVRRVGFDAIGVCASAYRVGSNITGVCTDACHIGLNAVSVHADFRFIGLDAIGVHADVDSICVNVVARGALPYLSCKAVYAFRVSLNAYLVSAMDALLPATNPLVKTMLVYKFWSAACARAKETGASSVSFV